MSRTTTFAAALAVAAVALAAGHAEAAKKKKPAEAPAPVEAVAPPPAPVDPWTVADAKPELRETARQKLPMWRSEVRGEVVLAGQVVGAYRIEGRPNVQGVAGKANLDGEFGKFVALSGERDFDPEIDRAPGGCNRLAHAVVQVDGQPHLESVAWFGGGTNMAAASEVYGTGIVGVDLHGAPAARMLEVAKAAIGECRFGE